MVFAVTGHTEAIYTEKALNSGMNLVLFKPVDGKLLKQLVGQIGFVEEKFDEVFYVIFNDYPKLIVVIVLPFEVFFAYLFFKKSKLRLPEYFIIIFYKLLGLQVISLIYVVILSITHKDFSTVIILINFSYGFYFLYQFFSFSSPITA